MTAKLTYNNLSSLIPGMAQSSFYQVFHSIAVLTYARFSQAKQENSFCQTRSFQGEKGKLFWYLEYKKKKKSCLIGHGNFKILFYWLKNYSQVIPKATLSHQLRSLYTSYIQNLVKKKPKTLPPKKPILVIHIIPNNHS